MDISFGYTRRPKKGEVVVINIEGNTYNKQLIADVIMQFQTVFPNNDVICLFSETEESPSPKQMGFSYTNATSDTDIDYIEEEEEYD